MTLILWLLLAVVSLTTALVTGRRAPLRHAKAEVVVRTFGKAFVVNGGFVAASEAVVEAARKTTNKRLMAAGAEVVLLGIRIPTNYGARYTQAFEAVYAEVAAELDIGWIEFFMEGVALNDELLLEDRIHPNAKAQPILLDNAWPVIRATLDGAEK